MALQPEELFLKRFVDYNKERYSDNPAFVAKLEQLTTDKIEFSNIRKLGSDPYSFAYLVDVDSPKLFTGVNQYYLPARFTEDGVANLADPERLTETEIRGKLEPGIYRFTDDNQTFRGAVLVHEGQRTAPVVAALIQANSLFELTLEDIIFEDGLAVVFIDNPTIVGKLMILEMFDTEPRFNGRYRYDGSVRAL